MSTTSKKSKSGSDVSGAVIDHVRGIKPMPVIGFICGSFDLLHAGHISTLRYCRERVDHLVVGLQVDPSIDRPHKNKPIQTMYERYNQLAACKWVSEIVPYETEDDLLNLLACEQFAVRFMGDDHIAEEFTGKDLAEQLGTSIVFVPRKHNFSSSGLRDRMLAWPQDAGLPDTEAPVTNAAIGQEGNTSRKNGSPPKAEPA